jgi:hypothetical protein
LVLLKIYLKKALSRPADHYLVIVFETANRAISSKPVYFTNLAQMAHNICRNQPFTAHKNLQEINPSF